MTKRILLSSSAAACVGLAALMSGCGDDSGLGKRYPVTGNVTYKGQPVPYGSINFIASDPAGHNASGKIKDGAITGVMTLTPDDGILPGKYKVTIVAVKDVDPSQVKNNVASPTGAMDQVSTGKAAKKIKNELPAKYANPDSTDITVEAKSGSNPLTIDLKD